MFYKISGNIIENMTDIENNDISMNYFKPTPGYSLGGDCDKEYLAPFDRDDDTKSIKDCAKECLKDDNCQRFSFGNTNLSGSKGLKCRISTDGKCPVTVDRYRTDNEEGKTLPFDKKKYGFNYWGGQLFDRTPIEKSDNSKSITSIKSASSNIEIVNDEIVHNKSTSTNLLIKDGKIIKDDTIVNDSLNNSSYEIYYITTFVIIILSISIYYLKSYQNAN
jgi:hypothetical protein